MQTLNLPEGHYPAVKREFIFKVDGSRPVLYSLDYINTQLYYLTPVEGFALSLLNGQRSLSELSALFTRLLPGYDQTMAEILDSIDTLVRNAPSQTGIGKDGLFDLSDHPQADAQGFDPRDFIIAPQDFAARKSNPKTSLRLDTPINVYTVFTHRCTTDCAYCYADRCKMTEMPLARWREIIAEMKGMGIWLAAPDNGDTFARRDGVELIECLCENELHFLLSTKAYLSKDTIRRLIDAGFTKKVRGVIQRRVQLSIDAVDDDVSRRILNIKHSNVARNLETVENFLSFGIMPKVKAVVTGLNYDQPEKIVERFYERGARVFHFVRYARSFHRHTESLFLDAAALSSLRGQLDRIRNRYDDITVVENISDAAPAQKRLDPETARAMWLGRIGCGGGWSSLGIAPNGKAFLCEQMKMREPFFVGDASQQSIEEIWHSAKLEAFIHPEREAFAETPCETCAEFETCIWEKGRCYRDAYFSYGNAFHPPPLCPNNHRPGLRLS